ncbi:MAG: T9SS C-terminal target domain-containing protein [Cytophagales bacterium]|nr:MAG: T9SS C-terminal target domain-containing protein [Cytophagales bacterium]
MNRAILLRITFISYLAIGHHFISTAQISGCTDPQANNFKVLSTKNDGSCIYSEISIALNKFFDLPPLVIETSGLIYWQGSLWTHNDDKDNNLYQISSNDGSLIATKDLSPLVNIEWEEISQDKEYIYLGDFGNNSKGNRKDLKIYKINKEELNKNKLLIDTINFSYETQISFEPSQEPNSTDFDCEAFVVSNDHITLFTKEWLSKSTSMYTLPKTKGTHIAKLSSKFNVNGLITGAYRHELLKVVVLCGYNAPFIAPFAYLLFDYSNEDYFSGNKRKILFNIPFHQVEAITSNDAKNFYVTNEKLSNSLITISSKLFEINLSSYMRDYLNNNPLLATEEYISKGINEQETNYKLYNYNGQWVRDIQLGNEQFLNTNELPKGIYMLISDNEKIKPKKIHIGE